MAFPVTKSEIVFILVLIFFSAGIFFNRSLFANCRAPVEYSLSACFLAFSFAVPTMEFLVYPTTMRFPVRLFIIATIFLSICLVSIYLNVQGIIWEIENEKYTPDCSQVPSWLIWLGIGLLSILALMYTCLAVYIMSDIIKDFLERRRIQRIRQQMARLQGDELNTFLLSLNPRDDQHTTIGLTEALLDQIPRKSYVPSTISLIPQQDSCAICLHNFEEGKIVLELPRCKHTFDVDCASNWLRKSALCPMCRSNLRKDLL